MQNSQEDVDQFVVFPSLSSGRPPPQTWFCGVANFRLLWRQQQKLLSYPICFLILHVVVLEERDHPLIRNACWGVKHRRRELMKSSIMYTCVERRAVADGGHHHSSWVWHPLLTIALCHLCSATQITLSTNRSTVVHFAHFSLIIQMWNCLKTLSTFSQSSLSRV